MANYKRIMLKLSGEAMSGSSNCCHDWEIIFQFARDIKKILDIGLSLAIVVGGGNVYRGVTSEKQGVERVTSDYMGMLATNINALALQHALESVGSETRVLSSISMPTICEAYIRRRALRHLEKQRVVILASGIGNPYFTTDTAAVVRAAELNCDAVFKGTKVDGVYSKDPMIAKDAVYIESLTYSDVLSKNLKIMDATAISMARERKMPIIIFSLLKEDNLLNVLQNNGNTKFTTINDTKSEC